VLPGSDAPSPVLANPKWKAFPDYLEKFVGTIQDSWYRILEESRTSPVRGTSVVVTLKLTSKGETDIVKVEDDGAGKQGVYNCISAIQHPQPYDTWTPEMVTALGEEQELTFSFQYQ
jgi:hypothetical protein